MAESNRRKKSGAAAPIDNKYGHLPPQALDIERAVLGALMVDKDAFTVVSEMLEPETFYEARHQKIFHAIRTLNVNEQPVDMMTVAQQLSKEGTLEEVGGPAYVVDLTSNVASSAHIEYHAQILKQKSLARQLIHFASEVETGAFDETMDIDDLMQNAESMLYNISQKNMVQDYKHINPIVQEAQRQLMKASQNTSGLTGVPTGYHALDDKTAGWQPSDLIIIAGRPAMGKTAFALSLLKNIAVDYRIPVAFFSLEMSDVQLANRLIANVCEVSGKNLLTGQLKEDEWQRFDKYIHLLEDAPIYIDDTAGMSIFELRTKARRLAREHDIKLLVIDYLQLMNANGMRFGSRQEEVSHISRSLKGLAKELNIPIIALSQLNRTLEGREGIEGKRPQLSDLRESGAIEQDADMVIFVHRPEYYRLYKDDNGKDLRGLAEIIIAKHRKGSTGDVHLKFYGDYTRFSNEEDSLMAPPPGAPQGEILGSRMNNDDPFPQAGGDPDF